MSNFDNMLVCQDVFSQIFLSYSIKHKDGFKSSLHLHTYLPTVTTWGGKVNFSHFYPIINICLIYFKTNITTVGVSILYNSVTHEDLNEK